MKRKSESLIQQCERLNIDYIEIKLDYEGKPEIALLEYFKNQGSIGTTSEGGAILTFMKACFLDKLSELNSFGCRDDACNRYLEAQFEILKDFKDVIINSIDSLSKETFIKNAEEILNKQFIKSIYPDLNLNILIALYDSLSKDNIKKLAYKFSENPYGYRSGWPDIVVEKQKEIYFIEVKTKDKLHESQLYTIPVMKEILPFAFMVYRIKK